MLALSDDEYNESLSWLRTPWDYEEEIACLHDELLQAERFANELHDENRALREFIGKDMLELFEEGREWCWSRYLR